MYQNLTTVDKFHQPSLELLFSSKTEGNMDDICFIAIVHVRVT